MIGASLFLGTPVDRKRVPDDRLAPIFWMAVALLAAWAVQGRLQRAVAAGLRPSSSSSVWL